MAGLTQMNQGLDYCETSGPHYPELIAIIVAGIVHKLAKSLVSTTAGRVCNAIIALGFLGYVGWRAAQSRQVWRCWGMRTDNFKRALRAQMVFGVPAAITICALGVWLGSLPLPWTFWVSLGLYPIWGVAQQFAVQNLIGRNLNSLFRQPWLHAIVTAVLFSVSHFPNMTLMSFVLPAGVFFTLIYRRHPNLWAVGIVHGLLGALVYYVVLQQDPGASIVKFVLRQ